MKSRAQRTISGLRWVRKTSDPWKGVRPVAKGSRAKGKAYEKKILKLVEELAPSDMVEILHNPWFGYQDDHGLGYAQPDYLLRTPKRIYIFECKLSQNLQALAQLRLLYLPLIRQYYKLPVSLIQVFKYINDSKSIQLINSLAEAKPNERVYTIHWLGT